MLWELVKRRSNRQKNTVKITPQEARQCHVECYLHTGSIHLTGPPGNAAAAERSSHIFCAWVQVQRPRKIIAQTITVSVPTPGCARWSWSLRGKSEASLAWYPLFSRPIQSTSACIAKRVCILAAEVLRIKHTSPETFRPEFRFTIFIRRNHPMFGRSTCGSLTSWPWRCLSYIPKFFYARETFPVLRVIIMFSIFFYSVPCVRMTF